MTVRKIASATVAIAQRRCWGGNPSCVINPCWFNDNFPDIARCFAHTPDRPALSMRRAGKASGSPSMLGEEVEERAVEDVGPFPIERMSCLGHAHDLRARDVPRIEAQHRWRHS